MEAEASWEFFNGLKKERCHSDDQIGLFKNPSHPILSALLLLFFPVIGSFRVGNSERGTWNSLSRGSDGADGLFRDRERESVRQHGPFFSENRSNGFQCCSWAISSSCCCW